MEKKTKTKMLRQLEILATAPKPPVEEIPEDEPLQASKEIPEATAPLPPKQKRIMNEKQLEGMKKGRETLARLNAEKKAKRLEEEAEAKRQLEDKIVSKAISIKKKQLKKEIVLDDISDDETPIEEIKQKVKAQPAPKVKTTAPPTPAPQPTGTTAPPIKPKPSFIFV